MTDLAVVDDMKERWQRARKLFVVDGLSYADIAPIVGIPAGRLRTHGGPRQENWLHARNEYQQAELERQRAAVLRARMSDPTQIALVRERYAGMARLLMGRIHASLKQLHDRQAMVGADQARRWADALRRCQEVEFCALAIPTEITELLAPTTFEQFIQTVRKERQLPQSPSPFKLIAGAGNGSNGGNGDGGA